MTFELSESEVQRYDRQIRVWGAEAQSRIQNSKALICGMNKINVEVVKNIVLAGLNLTVQDSNLVSYDDLAHNFFLNMGDLGREIAPTVLPRIKELNSFADVTSETTPLELLDDSYFAQYSVILMSGCSEAQAIRVNNLCRQRSPQAVFFWSDVFGEEAIFYSDFGDAFQYKDDASSAPQNSNSSNSSGTAAPKKEIKTISFPSLQTVLSKSWKDIPKKFFPLSPTFVKHRVLTKFRDQHSRSPTVEDTAALQAVLSHFETEFGTASGVGTEEVARLAEISSSTSVMTCSVLGSFLSQEVIKAVSATGVPGLNVFVFSPEDYVAKVIPIN